MISCTFCDWYYLKIIVIIKFFICRECKPSQASNKARDAKLAAQLWDESFKLLGAFADDVAHVLDKTKAMQNWMN